MKWIRSPRGAITALAIALLIIFTVQNASTVEVNFLLWSLALPRAILYSLIFLIGGLAGWLVARLSASRRR
jgi:uncharacterized integral membrane protein